MTAGYEAVIGLEVHVQLATRSKIFCGCSARYGAEPNRNVCPVCLGHPGVLPVLNRAAVEMALRFGLAVGAEIPERSVFARKNYFYPDLPKGYQITQYDRPILVAGAVPFRAGGAARTLRLVRAHLEEDAGKLLHPEVGADPHTRIDYNRAGVPLLEVVGEPCLHTPEEARAAMEALRRLVVHLGISDGVMEEGSLRCDANVSVRRQGTTALGVRTEIKNLNSFRFVARALEYEIQRQVQALESGRGVAQETRLWDESTGRTRVLRGTEEAEDYRYFPEPDLPPLVVSPEERERVRTSLPELPWEAEARLVHDHGISSGDAAVLVEDPGVLRYFDAVAEEAGDGRAAAHWVLTEVLRLVKGTRARELRVTPQALGRLIRRVREGAVTGRVAKQVFAVLAREGGDPDAVVAARGWGRITDPERLRPEVRAVLAAHPDTVAQFRAGKTTTAQFFVGEVMRATQGRADPQVAARLVREELADTGGTE